MADYSDIQFVATQLDYIARLETLRTRTEAIATNIEGAQGAAPNLGAAVVKYSGMTANLLMGGYRITGAQTSGFAADELIPRSYADGLAFSSALPSQSAATIGQVPMSDGAVTAWTSVPAVDLYAFENLGGF